MSTWSRFTSWLSGWPESKESKKERELEYVFAEEEKMIRENNKNIGKKSKKKKTRKQGNIT
jgi:hypothetical protein